LVDECVDFCHFRFSISDFRLLDAVFVCRIETTFLIG
jgi:hypothetical protein